MNTGACIATGALSRATRASDRHPGPCIQTRIAPLYDPSSYRRTGPYPFRAAPMSFWTPRGVANRQDSATDATTSEKRPRLRAPQNVERSFHLATMVEGMLLSSKLLSIGRLPEFADSNISLRITDIETLVPNGRSHRGRALLPSYTSLMLQESAQPAQSNQWGSGRPMSTSAEAGCGPLSTRSH